MWLVLKKDDVCFLQQISLSLDEVGYSRGTYPYPSVYDKKKNKSIVHQPNEVWGFDDGVLMIVVVSSKSMDDGIPLIPGIKTILKFKQVKNVASFPF